MSHSHHHSSNILLCTESRSWNKKGKQINAKFTDVLTWKEVIEKVHIQHLGRNILYMYLILDKVRKNPWLLYGFGKFRFVSHILMLNARNHYVETKNIYFLFYRFTRRCGWGLSSWGYEVAQTRDQFPTFWRT